MGRGVKHQGFTPSSTVEHRSLERILVPYASILTGSGAGKLSTPFKSVEKYAPGCFDQEAQDGPDCTSHGARNAGDITRAVDPNSEWIARGATEGTYGFRGHGGAGMMPSLAIKFLTQHGLLLRQKYPFADLSKYKFSIGDQWGRSGGTPPAAKDQAGQFPFRYYSRIKSVEQARDALANGYGVFGGSQFGTDGRRDKKGRVKFNDSWNHCMGWGAADETGDDLEFLVLQSWGAGWASGGMPDWGPIPRGSFMVGSRDAKWMIANGEFYCVGDFEGFKRRPLPDYGSKDFLG